MNGLRITIAAGAFAALACTSISARADEDHGLTLGVRTGAAFALGNAQSGVSLSDFAGAAQWPFWFDAGWRIDPNWFVGAWYSFGLTFPPNHACGTSGAGGVAQSCDGNDQRFGIEGAYHIRPKELVDPWVGLGIGYDVVRQNQGAAATAGETATILHGMQYFDLQLGADLKFNKSIPFGPFLDFSLGSYSSGSFKDVNGNSTSIPGFGSGTHEWLTLGVRAQFDL
jgi:hypothetical protein